MKRCHVCGTELEDDAMFCTVCGARYEDVVGKGKDSDLQQTMKAAGEKAGEFAKKTGESISAAAGAAKEKYQQRVASMDECFVRLTDGEVVIRNYSCSRVGLILRMNGYLMVTNKRLVFYGSSLTSKILQEIPIETTGAITAFRGIKFNLIILAISLSLFSLGFYIPSWGRYTGYKILAFIAAIIVFILSIRPTLLLSIKSTAASGDGIIFGMFNNLFSAGSILSGRDGKDTDEMMRDLGAIVMDLKQKGDLAVEDWK